MRTKLLRFALFIAIPLSVSGMVAANRPQLYQMARRPQRFAVPPARPAVLPRGPAIQNFRIQERFLATLIRNQNARISVRGATIAQAFHVANTLNRVNALLLRVPNGGGRLISLANSLQRQLSLIGFRLNTNASQLAAGFNQQVLSFTLLSKTTPMSPELPALYAILAGQYRILVNEGVLPSLPPATPVRSNLR